MFLSHWAGWASEKLLSVTQTVPLITLPTVCFKDFAHSTAITLWLMSWLRDRIVWRGLGGGLRLRRGWSTGRRRRRCRASCAGFAFGGRVEFLQLPLQIALFAAAVGLSLLLFFGLGFLVGFGLVLLVEQCFVPFAQSGQFGLNPLQFGTSFFQLGHSSCSFFGGLGHQENLRTAVDVAARVLAVARGTSRR